MAGTQVAAPSEGDRGGTVLAPSGMEAESPADKHPSCHAPAQPLTSPSLGAQAEPARGRHLGRCNGVLISASWSLKGLERPRGAGDRTGSQAQESLLGIREEKALF